jgi:hypothetical protein
MLRGLPGRQRLTQPGHTSCLCCDSSSSSSSRSAWAPCTPHCKCMRHEGHRSMFDNTRGMGVYGIASVTQHWAGGCHNTVCAESSALQGLQRALCSNNRLSSALTTDSVLKVEYCVSQGHCVALCEVSACQWGWRATCFDYVSTFILLTLCCTAQWSPQHKSPGYDLLILLLCYSTRSKIKHSCGH